MEETIILSNINEKELLKTFALNGISSFNLRILSAENLAKEALIRSGEFELLEEITQIEQECFIYNLLPSIKYFINASYNDAKNILKAINYARKLCRGNEADKLYEILRDGEFREKNEALYEIYIKYKEYLKNNNLTDSIEIINYAISKAKEIDAKFLIFKETSLEPIEEELLKAVSGNKYEVTTIKQYAKLECKKLCGSTYANAYGTVNEVEHIFGFISKSKIPFEDCAVILLDNTYLKHFINYKDIYNIPITFGTGQNLELSNSYKVLKLLDRWNKQYNAINPLNELLNSLEFNSELFWNNILDKQLDNREKSEIVKAVGNLKTSVYRNEKLNKYKESLTDKKEINRCQYVERFIEELNKGYSYLIKTYTKIENVSFETKANNVICSYIDDYFKYIPNKNIEEDLPQQLEEVISSLSNKKIQKELSKPGYLHVTDLFGGLSCVRKHMFICGLNAKVFPGSPIEDYLLLDSDLARFDEEKVKDSDDKIKINKQLLNDVINNACSFNSCIHFSYSGYNLVDLKEENPSSVLFEIFKKENGDDSTTEKYLNAFGSQVKYFDENITSLKNVGNKYIAGETIEKQDVTFDDEYANTNIKYSISPSSADIFFKCPKHFYLTKVLGIYEPEIDNPFDSMPANDVGTLVHECMEDYGNNPSWSKDEFIKNALEKFDLYFNKRISLQTKDKDSIKEEYLRMANIGYDSDPRDGKEVVASEKYLGPYTDPITGLSFGGYIDRLEKLPNGKYRVVDYKTYKEKKNEEGDIDSCFQVVLYAYILENDPKEGKIEIEDCEYRYLRNPIPTVKVGYQNIKHRLNDKLSQIKNALDTGFFPYTNNPKDDCKYCKLKDICGINKEAKNNE